MTGLGTEMSNATNATLVSPRLDFMDECSALDPDLVEHFLRLKLGGSVNQGY